MKFLPLEGTPYWVSALDFQDECKANRLKPGEVLRKSGLRRQAQSGELTTNASVSRLLDLCHLWHCNPQTSKCGLELVPVSPRLACSILPMFLQRPELAEALDAQISD